MSVGGVLLITTNTFSRGEVRAGCLALPASRLDLAASHRVQSLASLLLPDGDHLPVHVSLQQSLGHLIRVVLLKVKVEGTLTHGLLRAKKSISKGA